MARNCHNPRILRQQVRQVEEVPAQGARIEEVKEMTKEEKEKKADELRAQLKALDFQIGLSLVLSAWPKDCIAFLYLNFPIVLQAINLLFYHERQSLRHLKKHPK